MNADKAKSIEFGYPRVHFESLDTEVDTSCCLDWRAEIHLESLVAREDAPRVVVGHVDFLVLQLGEEPAAEVLDAYREPATDFSELFDGAYLDPALEGTEAFVDAHITTVLGVLEATVDDVVAGTGLRAWALAQVINTTLPTIAGLVVMKTSTSSTGAASPAA